MATGKTNRSQPKRKAAPPGTGKAASRSLQLPPAGEGVRALRDRLGLTQDLFARLSGLSVRTVADWEGGKTPPPAKAQRLTEIRRLQQALAGVMRAEFIGPWLQTPNEAFSGLKPLEVIERGEVDRIWRMIYELESGMPT
jgi:DNA-binding transcriptional regulator YiaG